MDDLIKSLDNLCAAIENLAEATTESKQEQAPTAAAIKKGVSGQLLEIMARAADAANDSDDDRSKLGQWVFEGQDERFKWAQADSLGGVWLYAFKPIGLHKFICSDEVMLLVKTGVLKPLNNIRLNSVDWTNSLIERQSINDVDYLTDNDSDHDIAPDTATNISFGLGITQADLQLIFIKNLSATLIQRMHSMDRFSEDDYVIGGDKLMPWDIVINNSNTFGLISGQNRDKSQRHVLIIDPFMPLPCPKMFVLEYGLSHCNRRGIRTITQDELKDFRDALEACYAN